MLEEPAQQQECGECRSPRRPAGINGSSPAPGAAQPSPGKGKKLPPGPCRLLPQLKGFCTESLPQGSQVKTSPQGLTLCQKLRHRALVALLVLLGLAGQLLVGRFQPFWHKNAKKISDLK